MSLTFLLSQPLMEKVVQEFEEEGKLHFVTLEVHSSRHTVVAHKWRPHYILDTKLSKAMVQDCYMDVYKSARRLVL